MSCIISDYVAAIVIIEAILFCISGFQKYHSVFPVARKYFQRIFLMEVGKCVALPQHWASLWGYV